MQLQSEAAERQKQEELQLKEMEAAWLKEQQKMREEEEKFLKQEKLRKQEAAKKARDVSIRLKEEKEVSSMPYIQGKISPIFPHRGRGENGCTQATCFIFTLSSHVYGG